jgi:hydroxymethylglutaryl-CoA synthase
LLKGALSQVCYYQALEDVYARFCDKLDRQSSGRNSSTGTPFDAETPDFFVFHAPYNKLVQKSYARLFLIDARRKRQNEGPITEGLEAGEEKKDESGMQVDWLTKPLEETYSDRALEGVLKKLSGAAYKQKLSDSNLASQLVGNTYTASVFLGLASLIDTAGGRGDLTPGKSIVLFSYGSGALATMYRLSV